MICHCHLTVALWFPAGSFPYTVKVCLPTDRFVYVLGLVQVAALPESSWQVNTMPDSPAEKVNVAVFNVVGSDGPELIVTTGLTVSTTQVHATGGEVFPAWSTATTVTVCDPSVKLQ